jgi:hypothetical protein
MYPDRTTIVSLIGAMQTTTGLKIRCQRDRRTYPSGVKVTDAQMDSLYLERADFHGEWNYTIWPRKKRKRRATHG